MRLIRTNRYSYTLVEDNSNFIAIVSTEPEIPYDLKMLFAWLIRTYAIDRDILDSDFLIIIRDKIRELYEKETKRNNQQT